jgi:hypothetical protein
MANKNAARIVCDVEKDMGVGDFDYANGRSCFS